MLNELRKSTDEHHENFNKEPESIKKKKNRNEEDNYWNEKYTRGINRHLGGTESHINDLEDRIREITQSDQKKNILKKDSFRTSGVMLNILTLYYRGLARSTEREKGRKCILWNYGWKHPKSEERNIFRYRNHRESPIRCTQRCTKIHTNT